MANHGDPQNYLYTSGMTQHASRTGSAAAPLRIAIRLWGYDTSVAQTWIGSLPSLNGALAWTLALSPDSLDVDLVVHMVKPSPDVRGGFCWNCVGANRALVQMHSTTGKALALFAGQTRQLPAARSGLWIAAGKLPPRAALMRLAHLIGAVATLSPSGDATVRDHVLWMIGRELDVA
ncbi:hypothetical protein [Paraburkholderia tropica]|uniref:hypothetical protein n=1 Tax=Paraburkholderia tropica TaxID=92647 RepID=UPI003D2BF378